MNVAIIYAITLVLLFVLAYLTKRRFGVLGLALAAGALLSELWTVELTPLAEAVSPQVVASFTTTIVAVLLVLAPALLLLISGPTYHKKPERIIGALMFALLAVALLIEPIGSALILQGDSREVYELIIEHRVYIVTAGLVAALIDLLFAKTPKHPKSKH